MECNKEQKRDNKKRRAKRSPDNPNHHPHPKQGGKSAKRKPKQTERQHY